MRAYLRRLADADDLVVVERTVDPRYEVAAVTQRVAAAGNHAVLFTSVRGSDLPVASNVYGSRARLGGLVGAGATGFPKAWDDLLGGRVAAPAGVLAGGADAAGSTGAPGAAGPTPHDRRGRLRDLPLLRYSEDDGGAYLTGGVFLAREPETGTPNLSFHRAMCVDDGELRVRLAPGHHLSRYQEVAERRGEPLEAAILIGVSPRLFLAATARLDYHEDELDLAARLAGRPVPTRPGHRIDLDVPLEAEVVIEGRFLPGVRRPEGPFGEFMGYYVDVADNAVFEVLDVSWRDGAVFHSINCGSGEEVLPLGLLASVATYQSLRARVPGVIDVVRHPKVNCDVVSVTQEHDGHIAAVLDALRDVPTAKMAAVVDDDVDAYDLSDVMWAVMTRGRPESLTRRAPVRSFEHDPQSIWGRLIVDACVPYGQRHAMRRKRTPGAAQVNLADYLS